MTFKVKDGVQVGSTLVLDSNGYLTTRLATARTISLTGDVSGYASFDGSANVSITATVADDSHSHSNYLTGESDTLASVTARGASTSSAITVNNTITSSGTIQATNGRIALRDDSIENWATASDTAGIAINYSGYSSGSSYFRDFTVYDGKGSLRFKSYGSGGYSYASGSMRAPIFYDSDNTDYYVDPNGTSKVNVMTDAYNNQFIAHRHSGSDFPNGTLVRTNIVATGWSGDSFILECTGKSYQSGEPPFSFMAQGYLYSDTIINYSGVSNGAGLSYIKFFQLDGYLCAWWPRFSYWNSFEVRIRDAGGSATNRVTSITDSTLPSGTKMVQVDLKQSVMWNYNGGNTGALYGSILYDSNDTGYYLDPNSTSNSALRMRGGALFGPNPTWGAYLYVGTDGRVGTNATVCVTNGNLHIDAQDGYDIYLAHYNSRWPRTPGMYDNNDTGYYVDFNGTSRMNYVVPNRIKLVNNVNNEPRWDFSAYVVEAQHWYGNYSTQTMYLGESNVVYMPDIRPYITYDRDNTGYYSDPASTSRLNFVNSNNHYIQPGYMLYSDHGSWQGEYNKIQWHSGHLYFQNAGGGYLAIFRRGDGGERGWIDYNGNATFSGNVTAYSDARLKENVETIPNAIELVKRLRGVTFDWIESGEHSYGLIAQEVEAVIPELVMETENGTADGDQHNMVKSVDYSKLVSVLIQATKEQQDIIDTQETRIARLEALVQQLIGD